jgi:hypothetical protein
MKTFVAALMGLMLASSIAMAAAPASTQNGANGDGLSIPAYPAGN